jgi:hypothetical protein
MRKKKSKPRISGPCSRIVQDIQCRTNSCTGDHQVNSASACSATQPCFARVDVCHGSSHSQLLRGAQQSTPPWINRPARYDSWPCRAISIHSLWCGGVGPKIPNENGHRELHSRLRFMSDWWAVDHLCQAQQGPSSINRDFSSWYWKGSTTTKHNSQLQGYTLETVSRAMGGKLVPTCSQCVVERDILSICEILIHHSDTEKPLSRAPDGFRVYHC